MHSTLFCYQANSKRRFALFGVSNIKPIFNVAIFAKFFVYKVINAVKVALFGCYLLFIFKAVFDWAREHKVHAVISVSIGNNFAIV